MPYKSFLISDVKTGLELDKPTFITANDAFQIMENFYLWRRRGRKKLGASLLGRLQRKLTAQSLGNTDGSGNLSVNLITLFSLGVTAQISTNSLSVTVGGQVFIQPTIPDGTLSNGAGGTGTINYASGALTINTNPDLAVTPATITFNYYPGLPVMAALTRELTAVNAEDLLAFDTKYAYRYSNATLQFEEAPSTLATTWTGTNSDFFWGFNAFNAIFTTNGTPGLQGYPVTLFDTVVAGTPSTVFVTSAGSNVQIGDQVMFINNGITFANDGFRGQVLTNPVADRFQVSSIGAQTADWTAGVSTGTMIVSNQNVSGGGDGIKWYDGTTWMNFNPVVTPTTAVTGAEMIFFYRDRLVLLNTVEGNVVGGAGTSYYQRARWSQNGTPFQQLPVPSGSNAGTTYSAWREDIAGEGGFVDAPTNERIVSASFLKDILVVFFERSTWKLRYTGNEVLPFVWERVDAEFGSEGTFSTVFFDIGPLTVGSRGIVQTDGVNVLRVDNIIPDEVFQFQNQNSGPQRIYGIRDFNLQLVYWAFPNDQEDGIYPNRVLCYNYRDQSWAIFRDSFTCFGKWQSFSDLKWSQATMTWAEASFPWNDFQKQALYESTVAGNQQGYISIVQDQTTNDASLKLESFGASTFKSTAHNLFSGDYVKIVNIIGTSSTLNNKVYEVVRVDANNFGLLSYNSSSKVFDIGVLPSGTYLGLGEFQRVDNFRLKTKKFNMFLEEGHQTFLGWVDFYVDATDSGEFTVNIYVDGNETTPVNTVSDNAISDDLVNSKSNTVTTYLNDFETRAQTTIWHTLYNANTTGNFFALELGLSAEQINDFGIYSSDLTLYAINLWAQDGSDRLG